MNKPLSERLPPDPTVSVSSMTTEQQQALAEDKARWLTAWEKITKESPARIRAWVQSLPDGEYKTDLRRRLNHMRKRYADKNS